MYGFILTNFHPWVCAVLERDIEARHVLALPELYSVGQSPVRARASPRARRGSTTSSATLAALF